MNSPDWCPDCRTLDSGQRCVYCHQEAARIEQQDQAQAREDQAKDDSDWIEHCEWCVSCRRWSRETARAILRARCPRWKEWGGPKPC